MHSIVGIIHKEEKKQSILRNIVLSHHSMVSGSLEKYFWPHIKFENDLVFEIIPRTENMYHIVYALTGHFKASVQLRSDFDYSLSKWPFFQDFHQF